MPITFRSAHADDFAYCETLYFAEMASIIQELNLDRVTQKASFREQWKVAEVRIIVLNGLDIGWLQTVVLDGELFLGQLFIDNSFQRRGIGTEVIKRLVTEAENSHQAVTLGVVKINPALRLYKRLGFQVVGEDKFKFYMRLDPQRASL